MRAREYRNTIDREASEPGPGSHGRLHWVATLLRVRLGACLLDVVLCRFYAAGPWCACCMGCKVPEYAHGKQGVGMLQCSWRGLSEALGLRGAQHSVQGNRSRGEQAANVCIVAIYRTEWTGLRTHVTGQIAHEADARVEEYLGRGAVAVEHMVGGVKLDGL